MLDLLIRGGRWSTEPGPSRLADVGVRNGRIETPVGRSRRAGHRGARRRPAGWSAPGFVDIHTHYDAQLLWDPTASPSVLHGVTTVLGGNCGFSIAPLGPDDAEYIQRMMAVVEGIPAEALEGGGPWSWGSFGAVPRPDRRRPCRQRRLPGRPFDGAPGGDGRRGHAGRGHARAAGRHGQPGGSVGGWRSPWLLLIPGRGPPRWRPPAGPFHCAAFDEFVALAGAIRGHPGTTLEFIPTIGPIGEDRMELMADMSLAADRPLNWNLLGSLASEEIYQQQLRASDLAAGAVPT